MNFTEGDPAAHEALLRLAMVEGVGPGRLRQLLDTFGSAEGVLDAPARHLVVVRGIGQGIASSIRAANGAEQRAVVVKQIQKLRKIGARVVLPDSPAFPVAFHSVDDPPFLLFALGRMELLANPAVAMVGTRRPSVYGREAATRLAAEVSSDGIAVVSGLARGIDTSAHRGALRGPGGTIAVLGNGIDVAYPPENADLYRQIGQDGLLLSEFLPGEKPLAGNFPRRNRLIAALSRAVIVVEMQHRSGAQRTVDFAVSQGIEVMAVPGPIFQVQSQGTNKLLQDGAHLVTGSRDVSDLVFGVGRHPDRVESAVPARLEREDPLLAWVADVPSHLDEIARLASVSPAEALSRLLRLEINGLVATAPGMRFHRTQSLR